MKIFIDPSELSSNSLLPVFFMDSQSCDGLESLTGCDFIVSSFPLPPNENTLPSHIQSGALFCQRKSGYDFIGNFEQAHREIARIQACKIPMQQAFILAIGRYYPDKDGLLRITGKKPLENNRSIKYETFLALEAEYRYSGVNVVKLNDESEIELWVMAQLRELETIAARNGKKELYPIADTPLYEEPEGVNYLQSITEIPPDDIRSILSRGFPKLGPTRINAIEEYATQFGVEKWGVHYLKIILDEDENGKALHNIKGIGDGLRKQWRTSLGLPKGYNLSVREIVLNQDTAFQQGINMAMMMLQDLVTRGFTGDEAFRAVSSFDYEFMVKDET